MELDYRRPKDMICAADIEKYRKRIAEDRFYIFLASLDHSLDQVSSTVLATSPLPRLEEAYSLVRREYNDSLRWGQRFTPRLHLLLSKRALLFRFLEFLKRLNLCFAPTAIRIHIQLMFAGRSMPIQNYLNPSNLREKTENLLRVFTAIDTTFIFCFSCILVSSQEGNFGLSIVSTCHNTWITDSRATDHMTSNSIIDSLTSPPVKSVQVANGNPMPTIRAGNVSFSSTFLCPLFYLHLNFQITSSPLARKQTISIAMLLFTLLIVFPRRILRGWRSAL